MDQTIKERDAALKKKELQLKKVLIQEKNKLTKKANQVGKIALATGIASIAFYWVYRVFFKEEGPHEKRQLKADQKSSVMGRMRKLLIPYATKALAGYLESESKNKKMSD